MQVFPHQSEYRHDAPSASAWVTVLFMFAVICGLIVGLAGCAGLNVERELDLTAADLEILAETATGLDKPDTAQALQHAADAIRQAHAVIASGGPPGDAWSLVDASLDVLAAIAEKEGDSDLALGVAAARIGLGRIKAYLPVAGVPVE